MNPVTRQSYLDWLRISAILGVLLFHSAMPFSTGETWHIKNPEQSDLLLEFNFLLSRFRMPLLFFISGAVCYFMLRKKTLKQFIGLRFRRLFIPLLAGMLIIVPPQVYMERLAQGQSFSSYAEFFSTIFTTGPYPNGNLSWHHLWFILYLFIYDLLCAPLFVWMISDKGKVWMNKFHFLSSAKWIYVLTIPSILQYTFMILEFKQTNDLIHDWAMLPYWLLFVFIGFLIISRPEFMESVVRNRRASLLVGFISILILNYIRWNSHEPWEIGNPDWKVNPFTYCYLALFPISAWSWVLALIGYAKKYLDHYHKALEYCNPAIYPFYILHQTIIVILAYYTVQTTESILAKYVFLVLFAFGLSMFIYHLLIRPYAFMRLIFGMKPANDLTRLPK